MDSGRVYDIRPQPRITGQDNALEGLFRVYLSADALSAERLKQGDWVQLRNRTTGKVGGGLGIVWRVQEANLKKDCVKVHDALRELYGFELRDKLSLTKYTGEFRPITKIVVRDVTDDGKSATSIEGLENLHTAAVTAIYGIEAVISGYELTVICRYGMKAVRKRQLSIESVDTSATGNKDLLVPYFWAPTSRLEIVSSPTPAPHAAPAESLRPASHQIDQSGLFGLDRQIAQLNMTMDDIRAQIDSFKFPPAGRSGPILICGPPGTGKSTLLSRLSEAFWTGTQRIECDQLTASAEKAKKALNDAFKEAKAAQPSCVIIDDLDLIANSQSESHISIVTTLAKHLSDLRGRRVLVVAATRKSTDIHDRVLRSFQEVLELPIPTEDVRLRILEDLMEGTATGDCLQRVAERTPAFIPDDLHRLCNAAIKRTRQRICKSSNVPNNHGIPDRQLQKGVQLSEPSEETSPPKHQTTSADFDLALNQVHPSVMHEAYIEVPKVHWTDIGGSETVKIKLADILSLPIQHAPLMTQYKVEPSTGILLYGPPGCSKTLTAKAVATESGRNFIAVKGPELISKYVGESEQKIREVFRKARDAAPSVIFFDEIDSIAPRRDGGGGAGHDGLNTVAALLNEMDGIEGREGVLVLAATNRPDQIDPALLRPQRLGTLLYLGPPGPEAREQILRMKTVDRKPDAGLDIEALVKRTEGYSGADVVELCNLAALQAVKEAVRVEGERDVSLGLRHFEEAFGEMRPSLSLDVVRYLEEWQVPGVAKI